MSLELIKKFLKENGKDSPELSIDHIDQAIESVRETEKARYISEAKKIRADIDKLKPFKAALEGAGYDGTVELPEFIEGLKAAKETNNTAKTELEKQVMDLGRKLKALTDENMTVKQREEALQKERKTALLKEGLKGLGDKLAGGEAHIKTLIYEGAVDLDEDGKSIVFVSGDSRLAYEEGEKKYLKSHEADLKDTQRAGAGSSGSKGIPKVDPNMSLADMMKLPRA